MNIQRVKQGAKLTLYNGVYMIGLGLFYIFFVDFNMKKIFQSITGVWKIFIKYNPEKSNLFFLFNILIGILLISIGTNFIYMSYFIIKRKEKMTWVILFLSGIFVWAGLLIVSFLLKNSILISLSFIGWISFIFGILLPIKYYWEKRYREY